jgi:general secretion pathway protein L
MARILGLDLGSHTLKGLVLETTLRGTQVKGYAEVKVPQEGERVDRLRQAIPQLISKGLLADQIVVALPGLGLATHQLTLPFTDPKRIDQTVGFEVEAQLPFDLSEAVYDYQVVGADEKGSQLLVGVAKKDELAPLLGVLKELRVDPRVVTHPGFAYQGLMPMLSAGQLAESPEGAVAILDIGHERACVAIGRPGAGIEVARTLSGGGAALTRALAQEFKITLAEAETWKEEHGAVGEDAVGPDAERASGAFLRALQPVLRELKATLKSYTARNKRPVEQVLLTGGTSKLPGLTGQLARDLGVKVSLLEVSNEVREAAGPAAGQMAAQAWALSLRGAASGAKAPRLNLRRGEFAFKSDLDVVGEKLPQLVTFGLILFVLLVAGGVVRNTVLERREKQVDAVLCDVTTRVLGTCEKDFTRAINMLKGKESPVAGVPRRSAVTLLAEVVQRIPAEVPVTFDQMVIDLDRISVRCEATSTKHMEDIVTAFKGFKCFKDVKEGKLEKSKDGAHINFRLDVQVECPDDTAKAGEG